MTDDGMRPPPRRQQLATNADFRKLLETPRAERGGDEVRTPRAKTQQPEGQKPKKRPPRPKPEPEKKEDDDGPSYRDRAEERRKGVNPDYERVTTDLSSLVGDSLNAELNHISVEDSKFLGGDVDHTHLVKGLDYALLQKVRGEMTKEEEEEEAAEEKVTRPAARGTEVVKFTTSAGKAVFNSVFSKPRAVRNELFLQGRTAFVYELEGAESSDVPLTVRRSKADCPPVVETLKGGMDTAVLERMVKIMSYMRGASGKPGKLKKKDKLRMLEMLDGVAVNGTAKRTSEPTSKPQGPVDADEDIFGGVGRDYVPEVPKARISQGASKSGDDMDVDGAPPPPPPPPLPATDAAAGPARPSGGYDAATAAYAAYGDGSEAPSPPPPPQGEDEDLELDRLAGLMPPQPQKGETKSAAEPRSRTADADIIRNDTEDAYEECYPDYGGFNSAVVDSDEEDLTHMDSKEGKSRYDFETEEQWEKYKANKEMMPKAAFQFGVKMSDGRKKQLGKAVDQKEQKQLRQIKSMLTKDHGDTYAHAFGEGKHSKEGGPAPTKRRRI